MSESETPSFNDMITLVAQLVPDIPKPSEILAEIQDKDRLLWLEGWCDGCIASKGFPPKGEGMLKEKLDYIKDLTPGFLEDRAKEKGMTVQWSGFLPLDDKEFLYGKTCLPIEDECINAIDSCHRIYDST
ncbi:MAG: hypothetical protein ACXAEJ_12555 [Candidatus Thorarchaeota archaeon]|jgi:hypothetical protein